MSEIERTSTCHVLNTRAMAIKAAKKIWEKNIKI